MSKLRSIPVIGLCAIFLFFAAGSALLSSGVYRSVEDSAGKHSAGRVALSYLGSQLRAGDAEGTIYVTAFGDGDALVIRDGAYETVLYCYDGYLMELYTERDEDVRPDWGTEIVEAQSLSVRKHGQLLQLSVVISTGEEVSGAYYLHSEIRGGTDV